MNESFLWYAARSTGMVAWALAAAAIVWGQLLSTRSARGLAKPAWVLDLHRFLGLLTLVMTGAHLAALVGDNYVHFGVADLFLPGASSWKTAPVAWGVIAFWLFLAVEITSLAKKRIAQRTWARVHLLSFVAYILATAHYLQAGTERTNPVVLLSVEAVSALVVFLTLLRILAPRRQRTRAVAATRSTPVPATPRSGHFPAHSAGK